MRQGASVYAVIACMAALALVTALWTLGPWPLGNSADTELRLRDLELRLAAATEKAREATEKAQELVAQFPQECSEFEVKRGQFKTLEDLERMNTIGWEGGQWTACTHLATYGLNFPSYYAR